MTIEKKQVPYEFLVRMNAQGQIAGAHVQFLEQIVEDGTVLSEKVLDAQPVSLAGESGFPISQIINDVQATAIATTESLNAQLAQAIAEKDAMQQTHASELSALNAQLAQVTEELSQMKSSAEGTAS
jgi:hypothetical protein